MPKKGNMIYFYKKYCCSATLVLPALACIFLSIEFFIGFFTVPAWPFPRLGPWQEVYKFLFGHYLSINFLICLLPNLSVSISASDFIH
jgi:hypothetical protein